MGLEDYMAEAQVEKLQAHWITSSDDLYSALEEDKHAVADLLGMNAAEVESLHDAVKGHTSPEQQEEVARQLEWTRPIDRVEEGGKSGANSEES